MLSSFSVPFFAYKSLYVFPLSLPILFTSCFDYPASIKKLQEQNESHQVSRTRMVEGMALALEKKDQVNVLNFTERRA